MSIDQWPKKIKDSLKKNATKIGVTAATIGTLLTAPENKADAQGGFNSIYRNPQTEQAHIPIDIGCHDFYPGQEVFGLETSPQAAEEALWELTNHVQNSKPLMGGPNERNAILVQGGEVIIFYFYDGKWIVERHAGRFGYATGVTRVHFVKAY